MELRKLPKRKIKAVFSDLDSTITTGPQVTSEAFKALYRLRESGYWTVIVSGRPAGWADCLMRLWPIDAMVFENGAGVITRNGDQLKTHLLADGNVTNQRQRLEEIFQRFKKKIPSLKLASDQRYRLFDYAIDFGEESPHLSEAQIQWVLGELKNEPGVTAKLSSIHINYWCGNHTKVSACDFLINLEGNLREVEKDQIVFVGDSPNDEPLFEAFTHSVGVANIQRYLPSLASPPRYVAKAPEGAGFCELVEILTSGLNPQTSSG